MEKGIIIGVMGGGNASREAAKDAYRLGELIAGEGWILLNGGRNTGIMNASAHGAFEAGGMTVGILPDADDADVSPYIRVPVITGMGSARNSINVLSSRVVVACQGGPGTISEIALALKFKKPVVSLNFDTKGLFEHYDKLGMLHHADTPEAAVETVKRILITQEDV